MIIGLCLLLILLDFLLLFVGLHHYRILWMLTFVPLVFVVFWWIGMYHVHHLLRFYHCFVFIVCFSLNFQICWRRNHSKIFVLLGLDDILILWFPSFSPWTHQRLPLLGVMVAVLFYQHFILGSSVDFQKSSLVHLHSSLNFSFRFSLLAKLLILPGLISFHLYLSTILWIISLEPPFL